MTQVSTIGGAPPPPNPNSFTGRIISSADLPIGTPVTNRDDTDGEQSYTTASGRIDSLAHACGVLSSAGDRGGSARIQFAGPLTLTAAQWAAIITNADNTHTLNAQQNYYLSTTDGQLTDVAPSGGGEFVTPIGRAISDRTLLIRIGTAVEV